MATIKLQSTKVASRLISYCEKRATERDGVECSPSTAKEQFKATRGLYEKPDGVQAHHVIQSFKPGEIEAKDANEIGRKLAEQIAPGHEAVIYTHTDKAHIHNHIVINAVSFEDGRKYHSDRAQLFAIREASNELCREKNLATIREPEAPERFSMAEYKLVERGERLWKDELRTAIEKTRESTSSLPEMQTQLKEQYGIEMKIQNKNVSFLHPDKEKYVRGAKLGQAYTKEALEHEYGRQREGRDGTAAIEREQQPDGRDRGAVELAGKSEVIPDHSRSQDGSVERQLQEGREQLRSGQPASGDRDQGIEGNGAENRTRASQADARDERDPAENRQLSGQSKHPAQESRSGRGEPRTQDADQLRGRGEPNEANVQGTALSGGHSRGQQPHVQPSVHAPAPSAGVQKGILDALAEAGKAIQRETAKQSQEAQQKRQRELQRLAKYQQKDRDQGRDR